MRLVVGLSVEYRFRTQASKCEIYCEQSDTETSFSLSASIFPFHYYSTNTLISIYKLFFPEGQRSEAQQPSVKQCCLKNWEHWIQKCINLFTG